MDPIAAQKETIRLLDEQGLTQKGWVFKLDNAKMRLGCCRHCKKAISLSRGFVELNDASEVLKTIKHEVAHALAGPSAKHGPLWKIEARKLGLSNPKSLNGTAKTVDGKYVATCSCGIQHKMHRRSRTKKRCRYCREVLTFHHVSTIVTPTPEPVLKNVFGEEVKFEDNSRREAFLEMGETVVL